MLGVAHFVAGVLDEDVVEARAADVHAANPHVDRREDLRHELLAVGNLDHELIRLALRLHVQPLRDLRRGLLVVGRRERHGVGSDGILERVRRVDRHDLARVDDRDPVAALGLVHVVGREEHRRLLAAAELVDVVPDVEAGLRVEPDRRFVEEQHSRRVQETARDLEAALHSAREELHELILAIREPDHLEQRRHARLDLVARHAVHHRVESQVLGGGQVVVERDLLEHEPDARSDAVALGGHVVAGDAGAAAARAQQRAQDRDGRGLAGTVGTEEAEELARVDRERDVVDGGEVAEAAHQAFHFDGGTDLATAIRAG